MKARYTAIIEPNVSGRYYAHVPDLPGCVTSGRNLKEAIDMITDAANLWLVSAEDHHDSIPVPTDWRDLKNLEAVTMTTISVDTFAYRADIEAENE
ncbi:MAG: type II toxin-antitoxin system HicB family antitoxin [Lachnospiraceae bacterium]|nr:type II toxin-antitoxin system HicB family antitoxin [Lachnospiraceae bacterium]